MTATEQSAIPYQRDNMREKINEIIESDEGIAMAFEVLLSISRDKVERKRLEDEYHENQLYLRSKMAHAKCQGEQERTQYVLDLIAQGLSAEEIRLRLEMDISGN